MPELRNRPPLPISALKATAFVAALAPLFWLGWRAFGDGLGANPIEVITHTTGKWTLILLLITLSVTPLRRLSGQLWLIQLRRMLGLFAFFYGCLHLVTFVWLDKFFDLSEMLKDVRKRPFITAGFAAFTLLVPLALTSTRRMVQRLGGRRWQWLHRLVYVSALAGVLHFLWLVKKDATRPLTYGAVLIALLGYRVVLWTAPALKRALAKTPRVADATSD